MKTDYIIRIDRTEGTSFPYWIKEIMHPGLSSFRPDEYYLDTVEKWLHPDQKDHAIGGDPIFSKLEEDNAFVKCLDLDDLLAIQAKGIEIFLKFYSGMNVFGWGSVGKALSGKLIVPSLVEDRSKVVLCWNWLNYYWNKYDPALRFR